MPTLRRASGLALLLLGLACNGDSGETAATATSTSGDTTSTTTGESAGTSSGTTGADTTTTSTATSTSGATETTTSGDATSTSTSGDSEATTDATTDASTGDTDGACLDPGELGPVDFEPVEAPLSEFFSAGDLAAIFAAQDDYALIYAGQADADFASEWLVFAHPGRTPIGARHSLVGVEVDDACGLALTYATATLGDSCETFTTYTRPAPLLARTPIAFDPPTEPALIPAPAQPFDCEGQGVGVFEPCTEASWCAPGLICAGITRASPGLCMDADHHGIFDSLDLDLEFSGGEPLATQMAVDGLATVDMDVIVNLVLDHPDPSALTITLTNPDNNEVTVWDQEPSPYAAPWYAEPGTLRLSRVPVGFSGDESVNGAWTLKITSDTDEPGTLASWGLEIMSRYD
ncbi:MAG: proprotein convertase P-domain-containing protein [Nannocystaceae bacterium]